MIPRNSNVISINREFFYDEKNYCFLLKEKGISFEKLYDKAKSSQLKKETELQKTAKTDNCHDSNNLTIQNNTKKDNIIKYIYENKIYYFNNPHFIEFTFPNKEVKSIFISDFVHLIFLLKGYKDYNKYYYKENNIEPDINIFPESDIPYNKIEIKEKIPDKQSYEFANKKVDISNIYCEDLSLNYKKYFENYEYIDKKKPYFEYSSERKEFFQYLENELKINNFIGLCGPKGIGKTTSILAFCRIKSYSYFYFNIKTIIKNFDNKSKVLEIIANEFVHCIGENDISECNKMLKDKIDTFKSPIEILLYIIENFNHFNPKLIVLDQYKTKYDEKYRIMKKIYSLQKTNFYQVIIISSINEEDVKTSIISCLKKENAFIKYIYVAKLIEVTELDKKKLNEPELLLLEGFGNYYFIY